MADWRLEQMLDTIEGSADSYHSQEGVDQLSSLLAQFHSSSPDYSRGVETLRRICRLGKTYLVPTSCILSEEIPLDTGTVLRSNFSDVYKGSLGGRDVAIKVFRVDNDDIQLIETAYMNEVVVWQCLRHPNIVPFIGVPRLHKVSVVSEWMSGGPVTAFLLHHPDHDRAKLVADIIAGVSFMHSLNVVHGDIKTENVLVDSQGRARLTDFGLSTILHANAPVFSTGRGTVRYMAPELLDYEDSESAGRATKASDTYATAITVWRVYSEQIPFATSRTDVAVAMRVLRKERPLRTSEMNDRGMTDQLWARITHWWSQDPSQRGSLHAIRTCDSISTTQARHLLDSIVGLSFSNPTHTDAIFDALNELAWWDVGEPGNDLAVEWIVRIYLELESLSPTSPLYGKGLRRLRTLCERTPNLPALFEVQETFVEDSPEPMYQTGMSDIHRAKNERRVVALKTIRSKDKEITEMFKRVWRTEAITWQLLRHPHIVPCLGILGRNSSLKLVSEWMEHGQLTEYLKDRPGESPIRFIRHVISGLRFIHSLGMVHGDIKGANILVDGEHNARIADFGVSVATQDTGLPTLAGSRGTAAYKAPETVDNGDDETATYLPTCASDVYATVVLIWELYAGKPPYKGKTDIFIFLKTLKGQRPARAGTHELEHAYMNPLWDMMVRGWAMEPASRCTLKELDTVLETLESQPRHS